jgi:hypothetical protein
MHLNLSCYVIQVYIKSVLEISCSYIFWYCENKGARGFWLELLTKSKVYCLPDYGPDIRKDLVFEFKVRF